MYVRVCAVCKIKYPKGVESLFRVPQDKHDRRKWSKKCGISLCSTARICCKHFLPSSIVKVGNRVSLLPNAEPFSGQPPQSDRPEDKEVTLSDIIQYSITGKQSLDQKVQQQRTENVSNDCKETSMIGLPDYMSAPIKRKRGRPRLDEPREIRDFDINLIREFKKFPAFYDRQNPQHRNREYTDRIWQSIAQSFNVSTSLVKTRMLQLRNRFNLEKRRVEAAEGQPHGPGVSQWSLYESLAFLSEYVKTRRPYSIPANYNNKSDSTVSSSDDDAEDEDDDATKTQQQPSNANHAATNGNLDRGPRSGEVYQNQLANDNAAPPQQVQQNIAQPVQPNQDYGSKYDAFGQFLASSLIEMNEIQALNLVQKFTVDLVNCLKTEERKKHFINESPINNTEGDDEISLQVC